jgi:hypothetical protein
LVFIRKDSNIQNRLWHKTSEQVEVKSQKAKAWNNVL